MTDWTTQGVALKRGDGASPEVFTTVADVTDTGNIGVVRNAINNTKLNSSVSTTRPGRPSVPDFTFGATYDPNNATVASIWTDVTTEDQTDGNWKIDLGSSPAEVISFTGYVKEFNIAPGQQDDLIRFTCVLGVNTVPTMAAT